MTLKNIIKEISQRKEIQNNPPVLIDIWASGWFNKLWKSIAYFSVCIGFDADERDFDKSKEDNIYKKLIKINKIVTEKSFKDWKTSFYLTKNPHCSSLLQPDNISLEDYNFSTFFDVIQVDTIEVINLWVF